MIGRCKRLIADCFAIITAGNQGAEPQAFARSYLKDGRPGASWVIGTQWKVAAGETG